MRKINLYDSFRVSKIIEKTKLTKEYLNVRTNSTGKTAEEVGIEFMALLVERWHLAADEIVEFLANLFEKSKEEIEKADLDEITNMINEIKEVPQIKKFFSQLKGEQK